MKSWKTTLGFLATGLALNIPNIMAAATVNGKINWSLVLAGALITIAGLVTKDNNVTGGTKQQ